MINTKNYEEKKRILKNIPNTLLFRSYLLDSISMRTHFSNFVDDAEFNGLLYIARRLTPEARTLGCPFRSYENKKITKDKITTDFKNSIKIGSDEFFEKKLLADAYFNNSPEPIWNKVDEEIPFQLLEYGHIFVLFNAKDILSSWHHSFKQLNKDKDLNIKKIENMTMEQRIDILKKTYYKELPIGEHFYDRLHLMPILF